MAVVRHCHPLDRAKLGLTVNLSDHLSGLCINGVPDQLDNSANRIALACQPGDVVINSLEDQLGHTTTLKVGADT